MNNAPKNTGTLRYGITTYDTVYDADRALLQLETVPLIEVDLIVAGQGLHCVRGQEIPCRVGDIFVIPSNTSHGYFV
ncbi:MAG: hypothetical protein J6R04_04520, partial [Clostridia bacterium]|nr:hypothetical protein [Clostridia bacterium]